MTSGENHEMLPQKTNDLLDKLISEMAAALISARADLHDERQVLRSLVGAGFSEGDALALSDQAIASARAKNHTTGENHNEQR
jgi:outer membrane protein TolC